MFLPFFYRQDKAEGTCGSQIEGLKLTEKSALAPGKTKRFQYFSVAMDDAIYLHSKIAVQASV